MTCYIFFKLFVSTTALDKFVALCPNLPSRSKLQSIHMWPVRT